MTTKYIGLDVHKETIAVAVAEDGGAREVRFLGTIPNTPEAIRRLVSKLAEPGIELEFCYEAGCLGYGVQRQLTKLGARCIVVAPSLIPRKAGDRVKTDRRDAVTLARLRRAGELTAIWVPDEAHEAIPDLVRARRVAREDASAAKQALLSFLLRHGRRFPGRANWTKAHWRWLGEQAFDSPHHQLGFEEYKHRIRQAEERCARLEAALAEAVPGWSLAPLVEALQGLRGVGLVVAATLAAEIGDLRRFRNPKQLMAWLGLVPAEHSSGTRRRQGGMTKTGNALARTMLVEAAWSYRLPGREERRYRARIQGLPEAIRSIAWRAQVRLAPRFRKLAATGKPLPKVNVAIARELAGFVWAVAHRVTPTVA